MDKEGKMKNEEILNIDDHKFKKIGISRMKVNYIKNVYKYFSGCNFYGSI